MRSISGLVADGQRIYEMAKASFVQRTTEERFRDKIANKVGVMSAMSN
jgi:20S proteasome alpha/beta subunit